MSILLEALRKSENSQKPIEPPNIHRNDHPADESGPIKGSHVTLLVVIALAVISWLLWQQYQPAIEAYRPPVEKPSGKSLNKVPEVPGVSKSTAVEVAQKPVRKATEGGARTPVETYQMSEDEKKDTARQERKQMVAQVAREKAIADNNQARARAAKQAAARQAAAKTAQTVTADEDNTTSQDGEYQSPVPEPIGYWELPDSVRNNVAEIKFSVLVYAEQPESRFVLINGTRLIEGDALKPGLLVKEIRRDGVVFSYQLYQFFVER